MLTKEHILSEIRRTASKGVALGKERFQKETGIKESDWSGILWTRWGDAVQEAGFEPNALQEAIPEEHLLQCLVHIIRDLGHFPTSAELKLKCRQDPDLPSHNTFNRLGRKAERARRLVEFCASQHGFADVADLAAPFAASSEPADADAEDAAAESFGFVYLMKSGKYYKIGKSVLAEKRAYEIQIQLPEELKLIHKIKTDDPSGIEAYWHRRFANKRMRGEWFNLARQDVAAFRRRKFM